MKNKNDYLKDLADIRSMMERSSKFMSLSGWAGAVAGFYALIAAGSANFYFGVNPTKLMYTLESDPEFIAAVPKVAMLGLIAMVLSIGNAMALSSKNAGKKGENIWNAASRQLVVNMAVPLGTGAILILILMNFGLYGLVAPLSLIFYGLALFHAGNFTFVDVTFLGLIQVFLGLLAVFLIEYSLVIWSVGFGVVHIVYGTYMYYRYER
jgi:hypothetical protein